MRKSFLLTALFIILPINANASSGVLSGSVRYACEAILCLSAGSAPSECNPALNYYYDIKAKKWKDTFKKRLSFLNTCPSSSEPDMPSLVRAIAQGAGRCDSINLLRQLNSYCDTESGAFCMRSIPTYCNTLASHPLTRIILPKQKRTCHYDGESGMSCRTVWYMPSS